MRACVGACVHVCVCFVCVDYVRSLSHDVASSNMISSHFLDVHVSYLTSKKSDDSGELFKVNNCMIMSHIAPFFRST